MSTVKNDYDIKDHDGSTVGLKLGGTLVTSTAAELNIVDGVTATATELNETFISTIVSDLTIEATHYMVMPHAGSITKIWSVTNGAVATADVTLTFKLGATAITNGVVTIATAASAAGDVDSATPTALNIVTAGQAINFVVTGGGAGGTPLGHVVVVLTRT